MPVCRNCDGEDFELLDGLYYCQTCNFQSQDAAEVNIDHSDVMVVRSISVGSARKAMKKTNTVDRGKPWYTVEGFQVILKAQVDALIRIGCNPEIRNVVKQIWFKFIHKSGIAIIDPELTAISTASKGCGTFRDQYYSGTFGKKCFKHNAFPSVTNRYMKLRLPTYKKSGEFRESSTSSDSDDDFQVKKIPNRKRRRNDSDRPWRSDEEWFSLASDFQSGKSDSDDSSQSEPLKKKKKVQPRAKLTFKKFQQLNLQKLVSILNVALQWCKEPVTVGDLINWIKQGYLPYIDCLKCLLPHMRLTDGDVSTIQQQRVPSYQKIVHLTELLVDFVEMPITLPDVDLHQLITRYVIELNLPFAFSSFIETLININSFNYRRSTKFNAGFKETYKPEAVAISLIIIALKLLCGLDDEREWTLDSAEGFCDQHGQNCRPFSWRSWCGYHLKRSADARKNPNNVFASSDVEAMDNIHCYVEHWKNIIIHADQFCKERGPGERSTRKFREQAATKQWVFTKLCDYQGSSEEMEKMKLARQRPYVFPPPSESDDLSSTCVYRMLSSLKKNDCDYIWYSSSSSRVESFHKRSIFSCSYNCLHDRLVQGEMNFHHSYDLVLSIAADLSTADKSLLHTTVQDVERKLVCPLLEPKAEQTFCTSTWS